MVQIEATKVDVMTSDIKENKALIILLYRFSFFFFSEEFDFHLISISTNNKLFQCQTSIKTIPLLMPEFCLPIWTYENKSCFSYGV